MKTLKPKLQAVDQRTAKAAPGVQRITGNSRMRIRREFWRQRGMECEHCKANGRITLATEIDHIVPLCEGGQETDANRQGLCWECHQVKTREEARRRMESAKD